MAAVRPFASALAGQVEAALVSAKLFGGSVTIGPYTIIRKIGEGGMGVVFEGIDPSLERRVAIKVLRGTSEEAGWAGTIAREARALARFSHPNVVNVFELGSEAGELYVCMEYVEGGNLSDWLEQRPDISWQHLLAIFLGAARGLAAVHSAGMVHRDFKLENLLVSAEGVPRVTDFGLARANTEAIDDSIGTGEHGDTRTTGYVGTPGYMAPEVENGEGATARSDQYSFFVTFARAAEQVSMPLPSAIAATIERGRQADPALRYPDMGAVIELFERIIQQGLGASLRAREVLCERVDKLWIAPLRALMLDAGTRELAVALERAPEYLGAGRAAPRIALTPDAIAHAMGTLLVSVLVVGAAGSGKSVQLRAVAEALLAGARASDDAHLPVILNLSSFTGFKGSFEEWLENELVAKIALQRRQVQNWLADARVALLLDGLDEVDPLQRQRCVEGLNQLRARIPLPYLVTCREETYKSLSSPLECDVAVRVAPIAVDDVTTFLTAHPAFGAHRTKVMLDRDPELAEQLRTPLLLTLFVRLADEVDEADGDPSTPIRERLYRAALDHALNHPRIDVESDRQTREAGLGWLAGAMARVGASELWFEELQLAWLPTRQQRWIASALALFAVFAISFGLNLGATWITHQPIWTGVFFGFIAGAAAIVINGGLRVVPMEAMRWSWPRFVRWIPLNLGLGVVMGGLYGLIQDFWANLVIGIATGLIGLSVIGLVPSGRERRIEPNEGIEESIRTSLVVAPVIGAVIGIPIGYLVLPLVRPLASPDSMYFTHAEPEFAWAVTIGTSSMVTSLFITGMLAAIVHGAIRVTMAASSPLPLKLRPWLDDWVARDMLTRIGGGWAFRHETLRHWLTKR